MNNGGNMQQTVQQPMTNNNINTSAIKYAPFGRRIVRDFDAPPYQGEVAPGDIPPGYHYVSEFYTLNAHENPRDQGNAPGGQNFGRQRPMN